MDNLNKLLKQILSEDTNINVYFFKNNETEILFEVLSLIFFNDLKVSLAAVVFLRKIFKLCPPVKLLAIDEGLRRFNFWFIKNTIDFGKFKKFGEEYQSCLLGLVSTHNNGFVRECALEKLDNQHNGEEIPFMLIRLNDWVPQIRNKAYELLKKRLHPTYAAHFIKNLSLVHRLKFCTREDHVHFINEVQTLLSKEECRQDLVEGLKSDDFVVRRLCFQWMALTNNVPEEVLRDSLNNSDDRYLFDIHSLLEHPHAMISRTASEVLRYHSEKIDFELILHLFAKDVPPHVCFNLLRLIDKLDQWIKLPLLIMAIGTSEGIVQADAKKRLEMWVKKYQYTVKPSTLQLKKILKLLTIHEIKLGKLHNTLISILAV